MSLFGCLLWWRPRATPGNKGWLSVKHRVFFSTPDPQNTTIMFLIWWYFELKIRWSPGIFGWMELFGCPFIPRLIFPSRSWSPTASGVLVLASGVTSKMSFKFISWSVLWDTMKINIEFWLKWLKQAHIRFVQTSGFLSSDTRCAKSCCLFFLKVFDWWN